MGGYISRRSAWGQSPDGQPVKEYAGKIREELCGELLAARCNERLQNAVHRGGNKVCPGKSKNQSDNCFEMGYCNHFLTATSAFTELSFSSIWSIFEIYTHAFCLPPPPLPPSPFKQINVSGQVTLAGGRWCW